VSEDARCVSEEEGSVLPRGTWMPHMGGQRSSFSSGYCERKATQAARLAMFIFAVSSVRASPSPPAV
jgi:hypothetical protein